MNEPWKFKLARVHWEVGQTLLPMHFTTQEEALKAEMRLHAALSGLPSYGVAELRWDSTQLGDGFIAISSLTAVTKAGFVIHVPGNAKLEREAFALEDTGRAELTLYLHVLGSTLTEEADAKRIPLYAKDPLGLQRVIHEVQLSIDPELDGSVDSLELARVTRGEDKQWRLVEKWAPPLLLVGPNPLLDWLLDDLDSFLSAVGNQLRAHFIDDINLNQHHRNSAGRVLCEVHLLMSMLEDMRKGRVYQHPYRLFDALRRLYFETCSYLGEVPSQRLPVYEHDWIGKSLGEWFRLLEQGFRPEVTRSTYQPFEFKEGKFLLASLQEHARTAEELYLLVKRRDGKKVSIDGIKLASPSRLPTVRRLALKGIQLKLVEFVPFPHDMDEDLDWYRLQTQGNEEWMQYALKENALAFFPTTELNQDSKVSLFWRA